MERLVFPFNEGNRSMGELLGGKGANLSEMISLGIPVPDGFTITTAACRDFLERKSLSEQLESDIEFAVAKLETRTGRRFGDIKNPLLVSVRSGAKFSMPGMMETVLNVGISPEVARALAAKSKDPKFAWDSFRRFVEMYGRIVCGVPALTFEEVRHEFLATAKLGSALDLTAEQIEELSYKFIEKVESHTSRAFPMDAKSQLLRTVEAVFGSWNSERATLYRRRERIPATLGTAVNVQMMVFGNIGEDSGTGVCFTRNPSTGESGDYGDYLECAQGEDVVSGIRNTLTLQDLANIQPAAYAELKSIMAKLENHYRDMCDIEFTIESGKLWILQTRVGKRTAEAAFRIASTLVDEGLISIDEALLRVTGEQLMNLMFPQFDLSASNERIATGIPASPGAAVGHVVFDSKSAVDEAMAGKRVILVRNETSPEDLPGMVAAQGILTSRGGKTSHAAVVARGMGRVAICGAEEIKVNVSAGEFTTNGHTVKAGDLISIDGATGAIYLGEMRVVESTVSQYLQNSVSPQKFTPLIRAIERFLTRADIVRTLDVRANADTAADCQLARNFGAEGVGLVRTEHMFLGERRTLVETLILSDSPEVRTEVLKEMEELQYQDFLGIYMAMEGLPVTVRLLDPPLHEFLTDKTELSLSIAKKAANNEPVSEHEKALLAAVIRLHEANPMMGLRGVRLGVLIPELFIMQVRAITRAAADLRRAGIKVKPEIMIPLVASQRELLYFRGVLEEEIKSLMVDLDTTLEIPIGSMLETPRAAITAAKLADYSDFFSFGTNDLTQLTWAFSRDDVEHSFLPRYLDLELLPFSPFESLDQDGVGLLLRIAYDEVKSVKPHLKLGVCGEHGGDPASIHFFHQLGLDYVSCSPYRVPIARLEAGRAAVLNRKLMTHDEKATA
jgi:pyruvate, orthophosphate dikinase